MPDPMTAADYILRGHAKEAFARDKAGSSCDPMSELAVAWCAFGALARAYPMEGNAYYAAREKLSMRIHTTIDIWSDSSTQKQVAQLLMELDL